MNWIKRFLITYTLKGVTQRTTRQATDKGLAIAEIENLFRDENIKIIKAEELRQQSMTDDSTLDFKFPT